MPHTVPPVWGSRSRTAHRAGCCALGGRNAQALLATQPLKEVVVIFVRVGFEVGFGFGFGFGVGVGLGLGLGWGLSLSLGLGLGYGKRGGGLFSMNEY